MYTQGRFTSAHMYKPAPSHLHKCGCSHAHGHVITHSDTRMHTDTHRHMAPTCTHTPTHTRHMACYTYVHLCANSLTHTCTHKHTHLCTHLHGLPALPSDQSISRGSPCSNLTQQGQATRENREQRTESRAIPTSVHKAWPTLVLVPPLLL